MKEFTKSDYFILYANCVPTKGASRSLVSDFQRHCYYYIPNDLFDIIELTKTRTLDEIYTEHSSDNRLILNEYFDFLIQNELGFFDDERDVFPDISLEWDAPSVITNSILDINETNVALFNYAQVFKDLSFLNCACVQIRCFDLIATQSLARFMNFSLDTRIKEIRLVLKYTPALDQFVRTTLLQDHKRISQIIFFGCEDDKSEDVLGSEIVYMTIKELSEKDCGTVCSNLFSVDLSHHTESLSFNSCLNRKISIDANGLIKNCPSQIESFGHMDNSRLSTVIQDRNFKVLWSVRKDDIKVCQDCEHRYICTDCRVFTQDNNDQYSKPSKCSYDPYTATWI